MSMPGVWVYAVGLVHASACTALGDDETAAAVNAGHPTGIDSAWRISPDPAFAGGEPNPSPCPDTPGRRHVLLVC